MIRCTVCFLFAFGIWSCGDAPTAPRAVGWVVLEAHYGETRAAKPVAVQATSRMAATVYHKSEVIETRDLRREGSQWKGNIEIEAGTYTVVLQAFSSQEWLGCTAVSGRAGGTSRAGFRMVPVGDDYSRLIKNNACPGCDLRNTCLIGANLTNARLEGVLLAQAHLTWADLRGANLAEAYLINTKLGEAKLYRADLSGANLSEARLNGADLRQADLSDADLLRADLSEANLAGANLSGANLSGAKLSGANLSGATWSDGRVCAEGSIGECKNF